VQPIHWFPGHMAKARREMTESLKKVDAILELVDARLPIASSNPMLREVGESKPRVVVMTRIDLADKERTRAWENYFGEQGAIVVSLDAKSGDGVRRIAPALEAVAAVKRDRDARRGIRPRPLRAMVVGIPNVGKSSLINRLAGRAATKTGDRPGITKTQQWIRMGQVELLDTPGVLWPKIERESAGFALAMSGAIKTEVINLETICSYFMIWASTHYPHLLSGRYGVDELPPTKWMGIAESWETVEDLFTQISVKRGLVKSGGVPDLEKTAELVLRELQIGKLGRVTFEWTSEHSE